MPRRRMSGRVARRAANGSPLGGDYPAHAHALRFNPADATGFEVSSFEHNSRVVENNEQLTAAGAAATAAQLLLVPPLLVLGGAAYVAYRAKKAVSRAWEHIEDRRQDAIDAKIDQRMVVAMSVADYGDALVSEGMASLRRQREALDAACADAAGRRKALQPQLCTKHNSTLGGWALGYLPQAATSRLAALGANAKPKAECDRLMAEMAEVEEALAVCSRPLPMPDALNRPVDSTAENADALRKQAAGVRPAPRKGALAQRLEAQGAAYMREYLERRADVVAVEMHARALREWARGKDKTPPGCAVAAPAMTCPAHQHGIMLYDWATKHHGCHDCVPPCTLGDDVCEGAYRSRAIKRYINEKKKCGKCRY